MPAICICEVTFTRNAWRMSVPPNIVYDRLMTDQDRGKAVIIAREIPGAWPGLQILVSDPTWAGLRTKLSTTPNNPQRNAVRDWLAAADPPLPPLPAGALTWLDIVRHIGSNDNADVLTIELL